VSLWRTIRASLGFAEMPSGAQDEPDAPSRAWTTVELAAQKVLAMRVRPYVQRDGGDIELRRVVDGVAYVRFKGACTSCPAIQLTVKGLVERELVEALEGEVERVEID
jgi:Fe-S cluster biogenesis protein NfuA